MFTNELKIGLPPKTQVKKIVNRVETPCLSSKKNKQKFQGQWSIKQVILTVFWNMKRSFMINLLEKDATINRVSCWKFIMQNSSCLLNDSCICILRWVKSCNILIHASLWCVHIRLPMQFKAWKVLKVGVLTCSTLIPLMCDWLFACLFGFYGISTFVGYLIPNPFLYK